MGSVGSVASARRSAVSAVREVAAEGARRGDELRALEAELARQLDDTGDLEGAADSVRRMKFLEKLQHEINDALTALES